MALFTTSKEDRDDLKKEAAKASKEAISSIISKDMVITGEVIFRGKARIDGTVDGNVKGEYLVLSESGIIKGDLEVGSLICHGKVKGQIKAKLLTVHSSSVVHGKLLAESLTVEPGAVLSGEIMASASTTPPATAATKAAVTKSSSAAMPQAAAQEKTR